MLDKLNSGSWLKITRGGHYLLHMLGQINSGSWLKTARGWSPELDTYFPPLDDGQFHIDVMTEMFVSCYLSGAKI